MCCYTIQHVWLLLLCYRGPRMVLAAAGAVDHADLVKAAESTFGSVPDETPETSVAALVAKV
jgi:processing peptidase subunit beta